MVQRWPPPPPHHQWVWVYSILWFFWSPPPCGLWWSPPCGLCWWYVSIFLSIYLSIYLSMYVCMYVSMYVCMYVCMILWFFWSPPYIHTYIHYITLHYIHTYHTYIPYIHTYIHPSIHPCIHTYIHTYIIIHPQGVSYPPHPMGGVGTRDTEPYIYIWSVHRDLSKP